MKLGFPKTAIPSSINKSEWDDWHWQMRSSLVSRNEFAQRFQLSDDEKSGFNHDLFQIRCTPYYAQLAASCTAIRKIVIPSARELSVGLQQMLDPLGERRNNPAPRIIHRYPDRVLFLVTDICSVYCRYCTRKHFTAQNHALANASEYEQALNYIRSHQGIREVILSGGDPLTLSDTQLTRILNDLRTMDHIEIIRIGTRIPVVCPMRITDQLATLLRASNPVYIMTHFNHPKEVTHEAAEALRRLADHGLPLFNQMVLLNGVNNHPALVQALSRRLLYLRVRPYYMFQCDPSEGTDHLRTSIENSMEIQRELWGRLSGLAMPSLSIDIPDGGGKAGVVPNMQIAHNGTTRRYRGWDGVEADYISPPAEAIRTPDDVADYESEWEVLKNARNSVEIKQQEFSRVTQTRKIELGQI
jgi:lysine 2,3-aminomutase